jgi:hypothetical protein
VLLYRRFDFETRSLRQHARESDNHARARRRLVQHGFCLSSLAFHSRAGIGPAAGR